MTLRTHLVREHRQQAVLARQRVAAILGLTLATIGFIAGLAGLSLILIP